MMKNILIILLLPFNFIFGQQIFINEVCTSNDTVALDSNYNYSDWIEIYNTTNTDFDIGGYFLSDNDNKPEKWQFPANLIVPANGFLLVWASEDNMMVNGVEPHTNFKLDADGESLLLSAPDTSLIDLLIIPTIGTDKSYGRQPDGSNYWYMFDLPSPGISNNTNISTLSPPVFSDSAGFYSDSFSLFLTSPNAGDTILYTIDGSEPNINNIGGHYYTTKEDYSSTDTINLYYETFVYTSGLTIENKILDTNKLCKIRPSPNWWSAPTALVNKLMVVKAKSYKSGTVSSQTLTHSYFIDTLSTDRYSMSVVSLSTDEDNMFDYYTGIHVPGELYYDHAPLGGYWPKITSNYTQKGRAWERPVMMEYFSEDGNREFFQNVGVRIAGNVSRGWGRKSFRIYARSEYDTKKKIKYSLFDGLHKLGNPSKPLTEFKRVTLRNSGSYWKEQLFQDAFCQHTFKHIGVDVLHFRPSVVFLNGEYWGVMNFRQRFDTRYLNDHYDIDEGDVVIIKGNSGGLNEGIAQDSINYIAMRNFIHFEDMTIQNDYDSACTMLDPHNFAKLFMTQIYVNNSDWLSNNRKCWKKRTASYEPDAPYGQDGRYRWFIFDLDHGFKHAYEDRLDIVMSGQGADTRIFRSLMENTAFRHYWINLLADNMNTSFLTPRVLDVIDSLNVMYDPEIPEHKARWGAMWTDNSTQIMEDFAVQRPFYMRQFVLSQFAEITDTADITINVNNTSYGKVKVNTTVIDDNTVGLTGLPYPWTGTYFTGVPVKLVAIPEDGYRFIEWQGTGITNDSVDFAFVGDSTLIAVFGSIDTINNIVINEVLSKNSNVITDNHGQYDDYFELYNRGNDTANISKLYLTDNPLNKGKWKISNDIPVLEPGGFALFWADEDQSQGPNHTNFKLSGNETLYLYQIIGADTVAMDQMTMASSVYENVSKGRYPNGDANIQFFDFPTPDTSNDLPNSFDDIFINEFMCENSNTIADQAGEYDDWIELYNAGALPVNVAGLYLTDDFTAVDKYRIPFSSPDSTTIQAGGFLMLWADNDTEQGLLHLSFKLNNSSEEIALNRYSVLNSSTIDSISYAFASNSGSYGRQSDGAATWTTMNPTPEASNNITISPTIEASDCYVYPNPTRRYIHIEGSAVEEIQLFNINGVHQLSMLPTSEITRLDLSNFVGQLYVLCIKTATKYHYAKIIVMPY
jgi:hypothetical protein